MLRLPFIVLGFVACVVTGMVIVVSRRPLAAFITGAAVGLLAGLVV